MEKIKDIFVNSSLSASLSEIEIHELIEEVRPDIEKFIDEEKELIESELDIDALTDNIDDLEQDVKILEDKLEAIGLNRSLSLSDQQTIEWIKRNWAYLVELQNMNLEGSAITSKFCKC